MFEIDEDDVIYRKELSGEELVKDIINTSHVGSIRDEKGNSFYWDTIDKTKRYFVIKWEYYRNFQPCSWTYYKIREL